MTIHYKIYEEILDGVIENIHGPIVVKTRTHIDLNISDCVLEFIYNPVWSSVDRFITSSLENNISKIDFN